MRIVGIFEIPRLELAIGLMKSHAFSRRSQLLLFSCSNRLKSIRYMIRILRDCMEFSRNNLKRQLSIVIIIRVRKCLLMNTFLCKFEKFTNHLLISIKIQSFSRNLKLEGVKFFLSHPWFQCNLLRIKYELSMTNFEVMN